MNTIIEVEKGSPAADAVPEYCSVCGKAFQGTAMWIMPEGDIEPTEEFFVHPACLCAFNAGRYVGNN